MALKKESTAKKKRRISRVYGKMGKAPGTVSYLGNKEIAHSQVELIAYDAQNHSRSFLTDLDLILKASQAKNVAWLDVVGINDVAFVEALGKKFHLSSLVLEDAVNTEQRPKLDEYDDYIFGVFKMLYVNGQDTIVAEHVALVLLKDTLLVFQEVEDDVFNGVRERIAAKTGRIRERGADYLFFALLDALIDHYFLVTEHLGLQLDALETEVYADPTPEVSQKIQALKKEVMRVRRWVYPMKELVARLLVTEHPLITKDTKLFLRDVHDHTVEINENLQIYREMAMSLMEMYMSNMSNKMNEVMKVLTIMATIFIPLTFIVGVYGMNFDHMPELHAKNGYYYVWGLMVVIFLGLLLFFKKKGWL
ncbi:magnesium/cobalt transporter CorA [Maribacter sp. 2307ULW6-5]|uniref:magnesium/cobalt transporter CorA n=1 Tax=Maribacter sp. 2307ULW6-5 TaxID=3386275 RepID=UPI0039BD4E21